MEEHTQLADESLITKNIATNNVITNNVVTKRNANPVKFDLEAIALKRNKIKILDNISLLLSTEHFILMTGQNGSGKSTLLKIISGLLKPDTFWLKNEAGKTTWNKIRKLLLQHLCYLHQTPYLFSGSVYDNIAYGLKRRDLLACP